MEVTTNRSRIAHRQNSSFECDGATMDAILGIRTVGEKNLRFERAHSDSIEAKNVPQVYAPIEIIPASTRQDTVPPSHADDRLIRLLDQQQAWYDAAHEAATAAEQFLILCEHHQQQWLQSPPPR